jgi:hypothetical protein
MSRNLFASCDSVGRRAYWACATVCVRCLRLKPWPSWRLRRNERDQVPSRLLFRLEQG